MTFTRYKKIGNNLYAYDIQSYWNSEKGRTYQKSKYLGVVIDEKKKLIEKRREKIEKIILDFGNSYLLNQFLERENFTKLIEKTFDEKTNQILALVSYKLCEGSAMMYAREWLNGNYAKNLYKNANLSSQRISEFLEWMGNENIQRKFFREYLSKYSHSENGLIIDGTSLPNQIHMPLTAWGLSGEEIDKQIRFILAVDKESSDPLFFRAVSGNILDVSTLSNTIKELRKYGVKNSFVYVDAGFFSEDNIKEMYGEEINFLIRLPAERIIYKELIRQEARDLESVKNVVKYGKRGLLIKQKEIELFGKKAYAHIVLDPQRKGRETSRLIMEIVDEKDLHDENELEYNFMKKGIMILVSSFPIDRKEIVPTYYVRQTAEMLFGFSKDDLSILPLRIHKEKSMKGYLFLQFLSLIAFIKLKNKLGKDYTVEEALITLRNLKCKVYDAEIIVGELTKQQKEICSQLGILMPKRAGI